MVPKIRIRPGFQIWKKLWARHWVLVTMQLSGKSEKVIWKNPLSITLTGIPMQPTRWENGTKKNSSWSETPTRFCQLPKKSGNGVRIKTNTKSANCEKNNLNKTWTTFLDTRQNLNHEEFPRKLPSVWSHEHELPIPVWTKKDTNQTAFDGFDCLSFLNCFLPLCFSF